MCHPGIHQERFKHLFPEYIGTQNLLFMPTLLNVESLAVSRKQLFDHLFLQKHVELQ